MLRCAASGERRTVYAEVFAVARHRKAQRAPLRDDILQVFVILDRFACARDDVIPQQCTSSERAIDRATKRKRIWICLASSMRPGMTARDGSRRVGKAAYAPCPTR